VPVILAIQEGGDKENFISRLAQLVRPHLHKQAGYGRAPLKFLLCGRRRQEDCGLRLVPGKKHKAISEK
jgi:hypothetical protein